MIYVSGRVDVDNIDHYRSQFESAKDYLLHDVWVYEDQNVVTLIDLYNNVSRIKPIDDFMMSEELEHRVRLVKDCDKIYMLLGWEQDDMCRVEHTFAKAYNKKIIYSKKF